MKTKFSTFLVLFLLTSCATSKKISKELTLNGDTLTSSPLKTINGQYIVEDTTCYARPVFILSLKDSVDRSSPKDEQFNLLNINDSIIRVTYEYLGQEYHRDFSFAIKGDLLKLKTKSRYKGTPLLWVVGKSHLYAGITEKNELYIHKNSGATGFILFFPGFSSSETHSFQYKKSCT